MLLFANGPDAATGISSYMVSGMVLAALTSLASLGVAIKALFFNKPAIPTEKEPVTRKEFDEHRLGSVREIKELRISLARESERFHAEQDRLRTDWERRLSESQASSTHTVTQAVNKMEQRIADSITRREFETAVTDLKGAMEKLERYTRGRSHKLSDHLHSVQLSIEQMGRQIHSDFVSIVQRLSERLDKATHTQIAGAENEDKLKTQSGLHEADAAQYDESTPK